MVLGRDKILAAFEAMGRILRLDRDVEILIVGGAAGLLSGELPAAWMTEDVDMIHCHLPGDRDAVLDAAAAVTVPLSLPASWMNDFGGLFAWTLPDDWMARRREIGRYGRLKVFAVGRLDLIVMKFIAHRIGDLQHLKMLDVSREELDVVDEHLARLAGDWPEHQGRIEMARTIVRDWGRTS